MAVPAPPAGVPLSFSEQQVLNSTGLAQTTGLRRSDEAAALLRNRYGVDASGNLNWSEQQADPFSVTASLSRLFRQQRDASQYGEFSGGYGNDGSAGLAAAFLSQDQNKQIHDTTADYTNAQADITRGREDIISGATDATKGVYAGAADRFAADPTATINPVVPGKTAPAPTLKAAAAAAPKAAPKYATVNVSAAQKKADAKKAGHAVFYWPGSTTPHSIPFEKATPAQQKAHAAKFAR
jgi:hypothetical protein